jgi:hypothetical protein
VFSLLLIISNLRKMKIAFNAILKKFDKKGEKTGWTYIGIAKKVTESLMPGYKKSFRVKGRIDDHYIKQVALIPMGDGTYILPVNASMRKAIKKINGSKVNVEIETDQAPLKLSATFLDCLADEPTALKQFNEMPKSHQQYYSKWIESAKTEPTKIKRIAMAVNGLARGLDYGAMLREERDKKTIR